MNPVHQESLGWGLFCKLECKFVFVQQRHFISSWHCIFCFIDTVLSTDCPPWWSNRANGVWVGVPVPLKTCHHFQNPPGPARTDCLHCASSQKQQHTVGIRAGLVQSIHCISPLLFYLQRARKCLDWNLSRKPVMSFPEALWEKQNISVLHCDLVHFDYCLGIYWHYKLFYTYWILK